MIETAAVGRDYLVYKQRLLLLQLPDFLLDGALGNHGVAMHLRLLPDTVQTVYALLLGGFVPLRLEDVDRIGRRKVQTDTARL